MITFVCICVVSLLSFGLFFFNVPYWTGQEMGELAANGFYRLTYVVLSTIGWTIYKAIETINSFIDRLLKLKPGGTVHAIVNLCLYVVAVYSFCNIYDVVMSAAIHGEVNQLKIADSASYARYSDLLLFWGIITNMSDVDSLPSFIVAVGESIWSIIFFVVGTILFFSVMYGLLMHKVREVRLIERWFSGTAVTDVLEYEPESPSLRTLPKQIASSILDFVNKLTFLRNFKVPGVQIAFAGALAVYSLVRTVLGDTPDYKGLMMDVLDESGIISTIGSFIISYVLGKLVVVVGRVVIKVLPESVRSPLRVASQKANNAVDRIKDRRRRWSEQFDSIYVRTLSKYETGLSRVQKINLE